jgi:hypothetical protein
VARGNIERYTLDMWKVNLLFLSALMYAQKPTGTIFGQTWPNNIPGRPVSLLVFSSETAIKPIYAEVAADGKFQIVGLSPGWHVLYAQPDGCRGIVKAVRNVPGKQTFASDMFDTCECWSHTNKDWLCEPPMFRPQTAAEIRASRIPAAIPRSDGLRSAPVPTKVELAVGSDRWHPDVGEQCNLAAGLPEPSGNR